MKLAWLLWLTTFMPQPVQDQTCLAATIYLEARNQSVVGQQAVAEVVLRRRDKGRWGRSVCAVVTSHKQFAPTLYSSEFVLKNMRAWDRAWKIAGEAMAMWAQPPERRRLVVPGADHFFAHNVVAPPAWAQGKPVATIGDHTFYRVTHVASRAVASLPVTTGG